MNIHKLTTYILLIAIFSCSTNNAGKENDLVRKSLNGNIKSYLKTISKNSNLQTDSIKSNFTEVFRELLIFNKNGNLIETNSYTKSGKLYKTWISNYDNNHYEVEKFEIKKPNDTLKRWVKKYDKHGNNIELLGYQKDSLTYHSKSIYNSTNKLKELIILKSSKTSIVKTVNLYDDSGNKIKETNFFPDSSKTEWHFKYDDKGNDIEWLIYDKNGKLERRDVFVYDDASNLVEEKSYTSENILESFGISKYDENGNEIEYKEYLYDSITSKEIYHYDEFQNRKTEYYNSKDELKSTSQLISEFDSLNNLIKEMFYTNGILETIKEYRIEYYK